MTKLLERINGYIWGLPLLILILGCGIYFTVRTGVVQFRLFPEALRRFWRQFNSVDKDGNTSGYQALCTALSATVGTGNIAGVAGAITLGGPGTIFWMWMFALLGMVVKFAEAALSVYYRKQNEDGTYSGGPMRVIENGLGRKWHFLAVIYCIFGVVAAFGVGNATQINTVISGINSVITSLGGYENKYVNVCIGSVLAIVIGNVLLGGSKRIGNVTHKMIPFACVGYILMCLAAIFLRLSHLYGAFRLIFVGAFSPRAVTSGMIGSSFLALRIGASRGLFTNEAGMGTAGIAHGTADTEHPVQQGMFGIIEVFLDTIVICTLTSLVILSSDVGIQYSVDGGLNLTLQAFSSILGSWIQIPLIIFLCLFAIATIFGWGLYGTTCAVYLFGDKSRKFFCWIQIFVIMASVILKTQTVWLLSETVNGLMAIPNIISLLMLSPQLMKLLKEYENSPSPLKRRGTIQKIGKKVLSPVDVS